MHKNQHNLKNYGSNFKTRALAFLKPTKQLKLFCSPGHVNCYSLNQCLGSGAVGSGAVKICGPTDPDPRGKIFTKKMQKKPKCLTF